MHQAHSLPRAFAPALPFARFSCVLLPFFIPDLIEYHLIKKSTPGQCVPEKLSMPITPTPSLACFPSLRLALLEMTSCLLVDYLPPTEMAVP